MLKIRYKIISCILAVLTLFTCFSTVSTVVNANDNTVEYTDVLIDLQKDENFKINEFPAVANDNKLYVIQIAESVNNELFVYVYQPSARSRKLVASEIRLSTPEVGKDSRYEDYKLTLLNQNGVFQKYKVEKLTLKQSNVRYYHIIQITRPFNGTIDKGLSYGNTVSNVPFEVSQTWEIVTVNGQTSYKMSTLETIIIKDKFVGFVRYPDGWNWILKETDSHFVAFSTDRPMEKLLEADLTFVTQSYYYEQDQFSFEKYVEKKGVPSTDFKTLKVENVSSNFADGWFSKVYTWKEIESTSEFLSNCEESNLVLTKEGKKGLKDTKWVLRFLETKFTQESSHDILPPYYYMFNQTLVSDVTILRLKFITDGKTFNLGVVDNKQTGSKDPVGTVKPDIGSLIARILEKLVALILIFLLAFGVIYLLIAFCPSFISLFGKIFTMIFKVIIRIIVFPFKLIGKLFKKKDKGKQNG